MVLTVTLFEEKIRIPFQGIKGYTIEHVNTIDIENPDILIHQSLLQQEEEDIIEQTYVIESHPHSTSFRAGNYLSG